MFKRVFLLILRNIFLYLILTLNNYCLFRFPKNSMSK